MKVAMLVALLASMCTPGTPITPPSPPPTTTIPDPPPPPPPVDAGAAGAAGGPASSPAPDCVAARQHMVEMYCQPEEDAFGGWVVECSGWPNHGVITSCITKQTACYGTRQCLGE